MKFILTILFAMMTHYHLLTESTFIDKSIDSITQHDFSNFIWFHMISDNFKPFKNWFQVVNWFQRFQSNFQLISISEISLFRNLSQRIPALFIPVIKSILFPFFNDDVRKYCWLNKFWKWWFKIENSLINKRKI
jgi:hypothetical protein